jgi:hypothetical protein
MDPFAGWDKEVWQAQVISPHSRRWSSGTNGNAYGWQC